MRVSAIAHGILLVPEPGTAWRRSSHHDLTEGKASALKGLATRNPMLLFCKRSPKRHLKILAVA
jgi:hypothetical protein